MIKEPKAAAVETSRDDPFGTLRIVTEEIPKPGPGEVVLEVETFGISNNNLAYALLGDVLGYWRAFPTAPG